MLSQQVKQGHAEAAEGRSDGLAEIIPLASQWEEAWTNGTSPIPEVHWDMIHAITSLMDVNGKRVLEVGSGTGHDSVALASLGAKAHALDLTPVALNMTLETSRAHETPVQLIAGDTLSLPFPSETFDLVFSQGLLEHFSKPGPVLLDQARVVRNGGYLLIDVPQRYTLYTRHKRRLMARGQWFAGWETEFSIGELESLLRTAGLEPVSTYGYGYYPSILTALRNLHTLDQRRFQSLRFPAMVTANAERIWSGLERRRWFHRWLTNIGVIARKSG